MQITEDVRASDEDEFNKQNTYSRLKPGIQQHQKKIQDKDVKNKAWYDLI